MAQPPQPANLTSPDGRFSCWIETTESLAVYSGQIDNVTASGYVASEEGKRYQVVVTLPKSGPADPYPDYAVYYEIDGTIKDARISLVTGTDPTFNAPRVISLSHISFGTLMSPLLFSKPNLREDIAPLSENQAKSLSTIKVTIRQAKKAGMSFGNDEKSRGVGEISEKTKKAHVAAVTTLGPSVPAFGNAVTCVTKPGSDANPSYVFTFTYMPLPVLQAFGFAPRPPQAAHADEEEDVEEGNATIDQGPIIVKDENEEEEEEDESEEEEEEDDDTTAQEEEELRKRLAAIEAKKQEKSKKRPRDDVKPTMRKKLKEAAKKDGGMVDLTGEDE